MVGRSATIIHHGKMNAKWHHLSEEEGFHSIGRREELQLLLMHGSDIRATVIGLPEVAPVARSVVSEVGSLL